MSRKIKGILFDLDGTLIDSAPDLHNCINKVLMLNKKKPIELLKLRKLISGGTEVIIKGCFDENLKKEEITKLRDQFWRFYASSLTKNTKVFPGVENLIEKLTVSKIPWGIVTNKVGKFADPIVKHFGWDKLATALVYGDTLMVAKPNPEPLLLAAQKIGIKPENCAYVGDTYTDISAASSANMVSVVVEYGYPDMDFEELSKLSDHKVSQAKELNAIICPKI